MNLKIRKVIFIFSAFLFFGVFGFTKNIWAATLTAANCSLAEVQAKVTAAVRGDTVIVPAGTCTWSSRLNIDKAIRLVGAGNTEDANGTRITLANTNLTLLTSDWNDDCGQNLEYSGAGEHIVYKTRDAQADENVIFEFTGFVIYQSPSVAKISVLAIVNGNKDYPLRKIKVHDNLFRMRIDADANLWSPIFGAHGQIHGVFYNNVIYTRKPYIHISGSNNMDDGINDGICSGGRLGQFSWVTGNTYRPGRQDSLFFEDNIWHFYATTPVHMGGITHGGEGPVIRYNSYYNYDIYGKNQGAHDLHGAYKGRYGPMGMEIYGNYWRGSSLCNVGNTNPNCYNDGGWYDQYTVVMMHTRAGRNMAFNNLAQNSGGNGTLNGAITLIHECNECTPSFGANTGYICPADTGVCSGLSRCSSDGQPPMISSSYFFGNRVGPAGTGAITFGRGITSEESRLSNCADGQAGWLAVENTQWWKDNLNCSAAGTCSSGIGCGPAIPTGTCTTGTAYWVTSQSCSMLSTANTGANPSSPISGTLYRCNSSRQWESYYTPYTYPHPLRGSTLACGDGSCNSGETCSTCPADCATLPAAVNPSTIVQAETGGFLCNMPSGLQGSDTYIYTPTANTGYGRYRFNITTAGQYKLEARINSSNSAGQNSFYIGLDNEAAQNDNVYAYHTSLTSVFAWDDVNKNGNGTFEIPQYDPMVWNLSAGTHTFTIYGREANTWLDQIRLTPVSTGNTAPAAPTGVRVI